MRFSAPKTADDIIVDLIKRAKHPPLVRVVTGDTAIRYEARCRRCQHTSAVEFVRELFDPGHPSTKTRKPQQEKPQQQTAEEKQEWLDIFDDDDDQSFDGYEAMMQ